MILEYRNILYLSNLKTDEFMQITYIFILLSIINAIDNLSRNIIDKLMDGYIE